MMLVLNVPERKKRKLGHMDHQVAKVHGKLGAKTRERERWSKMERVSEIE